MKEEKNSQTRLKNNKDIVIAKCTNPSCGWEVQRVEELAIGSTGDIACPMCAKPMAWEVN